MQRACAKLIFNLVLNPGARTQLVKLGIIATLRGLIGDMGDHVLNRYCALCLCVLRAFHPQVTFVLSLPVLLRYREFALIFLQQPMMLLLLSQLACTVLLHD